MQKLFHTGGMLWQAVIIVILSGIGIASDQTEKQEIKIPENINEIFETSCMSCHGSKGGRFPKSRLNFTRWAAYGPSKEAEKASLICSALRKGAMPPRSARESKPELIPTKEQIELICQWSGSLKPGKGKK